METALKNLGEKKNKKKTGVEGDFLKLMKHISEKPSENVILKDKILNAFLIRLGIRQNISSFSLLFNVLLILLTALMTRKESKIIKIEKRN